MTTCLNESSATRGCVFCLLSSCLSVCPAFCQSACATPPAVRAVTEGYINNVESFTRFVCRYRVTDGTSSNLDDALAGRFKSGSELIAEAVWARCDDREYCELTVIGGNAAPTIVTNPDGSGVGVVRLLSQKHLMTKDILMVGGGPSAGLTSLTEMPDTQRSIVNPFGMGVLADDGIRGVRMSTEKASEAKIGRAEKNLAKGRIVVSCVISPQKTCELEFDSEAGFLVRRVHHKFTDGFNALGVVPSVQKCSGQRWFPMKTISVQYSGNNPQSSCNVQIIEVTELKIDPPCRDFDFRIQLDQGASVNFYLGANPEYLTIGQARSVTADDLPTLRQQVKSGVVSAPQPQRSANRLRWMALGLGALAIVIGMLYRMRNKAQR